ncbi:MAG: FkbM family methyltransferase, partial [Desulfatirhabdiaceae bacterium]|nr:FkbM family methyltransferase [Desulfatirhabdiaceae bacterium]
EAVRRNVSNAVIGSNYLFCLNYLEECEPETVFRHHLEWAARHAPEASVVSRDYSNDAIPNRRLRVGYVSADFRIHPVAYFIHPVLLCHDREKTEVFCYSDVAIPDDVTQVMMTNADHWKSIHRMSDDQVFQCIQKDRIDILVDLAGHSGNNRMKLFARKPAPIQVAYLGYPNTTGLKAMDYRITDALADPPGMTDRYYTEKLVRLPEGFLCYHPSDVGSEISELPCLQNGYITFGSFNNRTKINAKVIGIWSDLLLRVPDSRLILKSSNVSDEDAKQQLLSLFVQNGIEASRIEILPHLPFIEHLKQYLRMDIALDTFPYNGTTTTCEALWMGVPVVTLAGNTHVSRVGASILGHLGLNEWIVSSIGDFSKKSAALASDIGNLKTLRRTLRGTLQMSSLMNEKGFVLKLEAAYRRMWLNRCANLINEGPDRSDVLDARIHGDITVCVPNDINCLTSYILLECQDWVEREIAFVRAFLKPGMNVVDIGANYGMYSLTAATSVGPHGNIWAFEPSRLTSAYLNRSIRRNQMDNITVIQAGVSDADCPALLHMNPNAEFDRVAGSDVAGLTEDIARMSLDGWMKTENTCIDFLKIDAEGQEDNIIRGGKLFFESSSPLILYEIKHGDAFRLESVHSFLDIGYQSYRLIPGLNILAPVSIDDKMDAFQLKLFCCKADCAETLRQQGFLVGPKEDGLSPADFSGPLWIDYLQGFPYMLPFLPLWRAFCDKHAGDPDWQLHQQALSAYAVSRSPNYGASDRYWALIYGYGLMNSLLQKHATISRILTATRMAIDLGYREEAVIMLNFLFDFFESSREFSVDEPFLSVSVRMATVDAVSDMGQWLVYSVLETREVCRAFSSYYTGKSALANLELMRTSPFFGDVIARRQQLIRTRFGVA